MIQEPHADSYDLIIKALPRYLVDAAPCWFPTGPAAPPHILLRRLHRELVDRPSDRPVLEAAIVVTALWQRSGHVTVRIVPIYLGGIPPTALPDLSPAPPPGCPPPGGYVNRYGVRVPNPCGEIDAKGRDLDRVGRNIRPGQNWDDITIDAILADPENP